MRHRSNCCFVVDFGFCWLLLLTGFCGLLPQATAVITLEDDIVIEEADVTTTTTTTSKAPQPSFVVAGYVPDYRFYINLNNTAPSLTDLLLFSVEPAADGSLTGCCLSKNHFIQAQQAVAYKREQQQIASSSPAAAAENLKLWLVVGGGGSRSQHFMRAIQKHPEILVSNIADYAQEMFMDGIDFDCEGISNQAEYSQYLQWLHQYAVPALQYAGFKVSVALHAGMLLPVQLYDVVDRVHVMTYDLGGGKYHADMPAIQQAVTKLTRSGCKAEKIVLGIPAYARHATNPQEVKTFAEMVDEAAAAGISLVGRLDEWQNFRGDSPQKVAEKVQYALQQKLGGIFFWELGQDKQIPSQAPGGLLLEAAATAAAKASQGIIEDEL